MELIIILSVIILDQISKYWIQMNPSLHTHIEIIPNFLYITYVKNTGAAWSMLSNQTVFLIIISIIETIILIYFLIKCKKNKDSKLYLISLSLMIGGAIGNLIDRIQFGFVRDFIDTYPFGYNFPVFNIADSALTIGVILLLIQFVLEERKEKGL